jgi:NAD(P)-dependent dehydrogenase (short-subunit alcohol dehydrogenase family)
LGVATLSREACQAGEALATLAAPQKSLECGWHAKTNVIRSHPSAIVERGWIEMPIPLLSIVFYDGVSIPYASTLIKSAITLVAIYFLKRYFSGARNSSERVLHGKVVILTGGTSGIGAAVARNLATRGAQLILLVRHPLSDPFLVDYIEDLRASTGNELITAEQVDLADLLSIRRFATQWIDNTPPRRLDMVVLCADEMTPIGGKMAKSKDSAELMTAINYLGNFHLISILSPALRAQPADRDVRVIAGVCSCYMGGNLADITPVYFNSEVGSAASKTADKKTKRTLDATSQTLLSAIAPATPGATSGESKASGKKTKMKTSIPKHPDVTSQIHFSSSKVYAATKLAMITFCSALQKHLSNHVRSDGLPSNCRVLCVDPGLTRTPGLRRYLSRGSLWGLLFYLLTYPFWWIILKSSEQGAQSFLWAAMDARFVDGQAPRDMFLVKECGVVRIMRLDVMNETAQETLWKASEKLIEDLEKDSAMKLAREKAKSSTENHSILEPGRPTM